MLVALLLAAFAVYAKLTPADQLPNFMKEIPPGFTAITVAISFFAGVQLMFLGVVGEYVGRVFEEVKGRPSFIVDQVITRQTKWTHNTPKITESFTNNTGGGKAEEATS